MSMPRVTPAADAALGRPRIALSEAMARLKLEVKRPGTDITHGTTFYTPITTLLARTLGTRREDLVYATWPILCCPYHYFEHLFSEATVHALEVKQVETGKPPRLWEVVDVLQSVGGWNMRQLIQWVRQAEYAVSKVPGLEEAMQAAADTVVKIHDAEGMDVRAPGLSEGIVIPATGVEGKGRVN